MLDRRARGTAAQAGFGEGPIAATLIPLAHRGLVSSGVEADEAARWLGVVADRSARDMTGARWQRRLYDALTAEMSGPKAAFTMLERYRELSDRATFEDLSALILTPPLRDGDGALARVRALL